LTNVNVVKYYVIYFGTKEVPNYKHLRASPMYVA
jgi:hypothetical protein